MSQRIILSIFLARIFLFLPFMTVAGSIPILIEEWEIGAAKASSIVSGFYLGYAISLLVFSWLADHIGAKRSVAVLMIVYSFFSIGDSPVLSAAMAERVEPGSLGVVLAARSLTGFIVAAISPVVVGWVIDTLRANQASDSVVWGSAFAILGLGGLFAVFFALRLSDDR